MARKTLYAAEAGPCTAYLKGFGSRELIIDVRRRAPLWAVRHRAWCLMPSSLADVIAFAETRGYFVPMVSENDLLRMAGHEVAEEKGRLW